MAGIIFNRLATKSPVARLRYFSSSLAAAVTKAGAKLYLPREPKDDHLLPVLCGWVGSDTKTLGKYATVYNDLGLPAVCATLGAPQLLFNGLGVRFTADLFRAVSNNVDQPTGIILHIFSGSSCSTLPYLSQNFPSNLSLKTVIFDSGPTPYSYHSWNGAMTQMLKCRKINHLTFSLAKLLGVVLERVYGQRKRNIDARARASEIFDVPQLYLHSDADSVIPSDSITEVINEQTNLGRIVERVQWKDSEHVKHLMRYPDEYCRSIYTFLDNHGIHQKNQYNSRDF